MGDFLNRSSKNTILIEEDVAKGHIKYKTWNKINSNYTSYYCINNNNLYCKQITMQIRKCFVCFSNT